MKVRPNRIGFTLIELLVVIAIIAILAAILFPVFAQAREKARQSTCLSNEKQIGLGMMQYVQDYDEFYPPSLINTGTVDYDWTVCINPYIKNGTSYTTNGQVHTYYDGVFSCPSALRHQMNEYTLRMDVFPDWYGNPPLSGASASGPAISMAKLSSPASAVGMWESGADGGSTTVNGQKVYTNSCIAAVSDWWIWGAGTSWFAGAALDCDEKDGTSGGGWVSCNGWPRYRHQGTCNVLYLDGHAKALHKKDWYNSDFAQTGLDCEAFWWGC